MAGIDIFAASGMHFARRFTHYFAHSPFYIVRWLFHRFSAHSLTIIKYFAAFDLLFSFRRHYIDIYCFMLTRRPILLLIISRYRHNSFRARFIYIRGVRPCSCRIRASSHVIAWYYFDISRRLFWCAFSRHILRSKSIFHGCKPNTDVYSAWAGWEITRQVSCRRSRFQPHTISISRGRLIFLLATPGRIFACFYRCIERMLFSSRYYACAIAAWRRVDY